ncbi:hypothetical protein ANANG_G00098980 [Anguilla anguilla]|uniref:CARMIL C-terminal domain-containing protein n=1 Tax=Anguilla anguilla TaxID=7936 RepID=A0A9D3RYH8_ANGAN|nr:hypothetical protein ANANG_G00098980 [Anguilla anguilla]
MKKKDVCLRSTCVSLPAPRCPDARSCTQVPRAAAMVSESPEVSFGLQDAIAQLLKPHKVWFMVQVQLNQSKTRTESRVLVMTMWRAYMFHCKQPVKVESSFSYLEIYAIIIGNLEQVVIETDRQTYCLSLMSVEDLEAVISHVTASLKKIFPDSSPGKLLKKIPPDLQDRLRSLTSSVEESLNGTQGPCGGFSETYAALCDFNDFPCREEIKWDVDNIYHIQSCQEFNLLDFNHLDTRDISLAVAALSFNHWFTKISGKDFRLSPEVQEQVLYMINRSPKLEDVCLENSGLKPDFAVKMACAIRDHPSSALHIINLSANPIEDKGVIALSHQLEKLPKGLTQLCLSRVSLSPKGVGTLAQAFSHSKLFSSSLRHLDLSGNVGSLATGEATNLLNFLSSENAVSHLNLSGTDCPLDALFVSLSSGCCSKLSYLNLSRNSFSHRTAREVTRSVKDFFSKSAELKYVVLAGTRLPAAALRLLLQGLATNTLLSGLELDLSSCELRSAGAQVIQEHIFEAKAISSLDLSDNGLESDMVTLVLSIGRSHSIRHLALGGNFAMKSRALTDVLHRIVQLIQEEECPLESLSVSDSKLKTGTTTLINSLGNLTKIDISGNCIGDTGAKMLAKALLTNTKLRTLVWDRNNVTASGFLDVASALERNSTLLHMPVPMSDALQAYRGSPERTDEALQRIQACLVRNSRGQAAASEQVLRLQQEMKTRCSEKVQQMCVKVQKTVQPLINCSVQEVQSDILSAEEVLHNARVSIGMLPTLYNLGRAPSSENMLQHILNDSAHSLTTEITTEIQELVQSMLQSVQAVCPRVVQRSSVSEKLADYVARKSRHAAHFVEETLEKQAGELIRNKLRELKLSVSVCLAESVVDQILQDLSASQQKLDRHVRDHTQPLSGSAPRTNIPQLRVVEEEFPTDEYVPVIWRSSFHSRSIRPAPSVKSLLDVDSDFQQTSEGRQQQHQQQQQQSREEEEQEEVGGAETAWGRAASSPSSLSVTAARPKPGPSHPPEEEEDDAAALRRLSSQPRRSEPAPPRPPMDLPSEGQRLRHFTQTRPRPNRRNRQPPSKPQEPAAESENDQNETMGRVDEGVEEFFTKKIIPDNPLKSQREEPPVKAQPVEPASSAPSTGPSKNIKKKFGDFFAFKKVRAARGPRHTHALPHPRSRPCPVVEREKSRTLEKSRTPVGERKLKATRRSLREGKSQSLILLTGLEPDDAGTRSKKHLSEKGSSNEGPSSFEQRVHVMLHRMGVTKTLPSDSRRAQNKEGELRKADSEGTIIDSKPEPPPTFMKPRTMSTSSDMRRPVRVGVSTLESRRASGPGERPPLPERPGPLPPKPAIKPPLPVPLPVPEPAASAPPPRTSPATPVQPSTSPSREDKPAEPDTPSPSPGTRPPPPQKGDTPGTVTTQGVSLGDSRVRAEKAQSVTEETLPKPRPRMKPSPQRRAVSVHEESLREHAALLDPEELKAALPRLQRSPVRKRANLGSFLPAVKTSLRRGGGERKSDTNLNSQETDASSVVEKGAGLSPAGAGQEDATAEAKEEEEEGGEMVSQQHMPQGGAEPSDQRTDPPSLRNT